MIASVWVPVAVGALVVASACLVAMVVGGWALWSMGRRKWRAFYRHGAVVGAIGLWEMVAPARMRGNARRRGNDTQRHDKTRNELWRSVQQAESAVAAAVASDAAIGSLPLLCSRLRQAAVAVDRLLQVDPVPDSVRAQAAEVVRTATDLRQAAVASASDANGQRIGALVRDAEDELQCLDAGLASARATLGRVRH